MQVTFCKKCGNNAKMFKLNETDTAFITKNQIVKSLPNPSIITKRERQYYQFEEEIPVIEQP